MSYGSFLNGGVSQTGSTNTPRHRYNTRLAARTGSYVQPRSSVERPGAGSIANSVIFNPCEFGEPESREPQNQMDYCYDPYERAFPQRCGSWTQLFLKVLNVIAVLTLAYVLFMFYTEIQNLKQEVRIVRFGNKSQVKMDPKKAKLKEIEMTCKESLKSLLNRDPVGRPDFALESTGGRIIGAESKVYVAEPKTFLGFRLCEGQNGPNSVIQPTTAPGECWAFKGHYASVIIQLLDAVRVDSVTLEHIPANISPSGGIDSAPKDFKIWGLNDSKGDSRKFLGQFIYAADGDPIQTFPVCNNTSYFRYIQFEFLSNHGNDDYTCVYRVRVHGTVFKPK